MELRNKNFDFESYKEYIQIYEDARKQDEIESTNFYKLVKYVKARQGTDEVRTNAYVSEFMKRYKIDMIEVPDEFKDLEVGDDFRPLKKRGRSV